MSAATSAPQDSGPVVESVSATDKPPSMLVMSGGEGYIDFRIGKKRVFFLFFFLDFCYAPLLGFSLTSYCQFFQTFSLFIIPCVIIYNIINILYMCHNVFMYTLGEISWLETSFYKKNWPLFFFNCFESLTD